LPRTVTFPAAVVLILWCVMRALMADAWATPLERVEFEGASQRIISGGLIAGDRIQGYLAKPEGAGPFPTVIGLHGCAGMSGTTKQKLVGELVGWGYVVLLVDSFGTARYRSRLL
jgi:dipeptidyl aminopeptidase/acylaminoacyl peptidase